MNTFVLNFQLKLITSLRAQFSLDIFKRHHRPKDCHNANPVMKWVDNDWPHLPTFRNHSKNWWVHAILLVWSSFEDNKSLPSYSWWLSDQGQSLHPVRVLHTTDYKAKVAWSSCNHTKTDKLFRWLSFLSLCLVMNLTIILVWSLSTLLSMTEAYSVGVLPNYPSRFLCICCFHLDSFLFTWFFLFQDNILANSRPLNVDAMMWCFMFL